MRSNDELWLRPAFAAIKETDPAIWRAMQESDWNVQVVDQPSDLRPYVESDGPMITMELVMALSQADGATISGMNVPGMEVPPDLRGVTFLNRAFLIGLAEQTQSPEPDYVAMVLVHEWTHFQGDTTEPPAYTAGAKFAAARGEVPLAIAQIETLRGLQEAGEA